MRRTGTVSALMCHAPLYATVHAASQPSLPLHRPGFADTRERLASCHVTARRRAPRPKRSPPLPALPTHARHKAHSPASQYTTHTGVGCHAQLGLGTTAWACWFVSFFAVVCAGRFDVRLHFAPVDWGVESPCGHWHVWSRAVVPAFLFVSVFGQLYRNIYGNRTHAAHASLLQVTGACGAPRRTNARPQPGMRFRGNRSSVNINRCTTQCIRAMQRCYAAPAPVPAADRTRETTAAQEGAPCCAGLLGGGRVGDGVG